MAENYNLGSSFGYNVSQKKVKQQQVQKTPPTNLNETVGNLFDSMTGYVAKYENVFNGDVAKEINMYSRQSMIVGMNMKASDKTHPKFDMNI